MKYSSEEIYKNFCQVNNSYWQEKERAPRLQKILVEGFFAKAGSNYAIRVGSIAKTVEEVLNLDSVVLLQSGLKKEQDKVEIWQSFNLKNFIGLREDIFKNFFRIKRLAIGFIAFLYYVLARFLFFIKQVDLFLKLRFAGIVIGDLIYDELVKQNEFVKESVNKEYQILSIKSKHKEIFKRTFFYLFSAISLYKRYFPKCYIATHSQYVNYGVLVRYFLARGVTIIETTDDILFIHDNSKNLPKFHIAVREVIKNKLPEALRDKDRQYFIEKKLQKRFCGEEEQVDAKLAYANKKICDDLQSLRNELGITNDYGFVFIFAHVFADAPRSLGEGMLFKDYYDWLKETITCVNKINNLNWIIKPHPSSKAYGEVGEVKNIINKVCDKKVNVYLCPDNLSTASVLNCAKSIITVQGTVGIEFACFGIPIIVAGKPFYSGFDFTLEPSSKSEYYKLLNELDKVKPLNSKQIETARAVYSVFSDIFNKDFSLIDSVIKDKVWGCEKPRDIDGSFALMSERLKVINPKEMYFCQEIRSCFAKKIV